jgi:LysR family transcriptional regulator, transcriptional activator of the cysJI operon
MEDAGPRKTAPSRRPARIRRRDLCPGEVRGRFNMHIETLKVFCDLVESCSFSQAAVRNFITQSAVSQQIKNLESRFDTPLLVRGGRSVTPTEAGRVVYQSSRAILDKFERMQTEMKSLGHELVGSVRLATIYSVGLYEMSRVIKTFLKTYPKVNLHVEYSPAPRVYEDCLKGTVDLGIVPYPKPSKGLEVISLRADRLILICSPEHEFARHRHISLAKLDGENFVAFQRDIPSRHAIDQILEQNNVKVRVVMEFDNIETIKRSVEIGAGVSIVPSPSVEREVQSGSLVQLKFTRLDFFRPLGAIVKRQRSLPAPVQKFVELLQHPE